MCITEWVVLRFFVYSLADIQCPWRWWFSKVWQSRERWWLPHSLFKRLPFPHFIVLLPLFTTFHWVYPNLLNIWCYQLGSEAFFLVASFVERLHPHEALRGGHNGGIAPSLFLPKVHMIDGGGEKIKRWGKF